MVSPNYYSQTIVNIGGTSTPVTTNHNTLDQPVVNRLLTVNSTTGEVTDGILQGFKEWLASTSANAAIVSMLGQNFTELKELVEHGTPNPPVSGQPTYYVSEPVAKAAEALLNSLAAVGADLNNPSPEDIMEWQSIAVFNNDIRSVVEQLVNSVKIVPSLNSSGVTVYSVVSAAGTISPVEGNKLSGSLQAMIELIYIKGANQYLADNLESLESALGTTKLATDSLGDLQNLHNLLKVYSAGASGIDLSVTTAGGAAAAADSPTAVAARTKYEALSKSFFEASPVPQLDGSFEDIGTALTAVADFIAANGSALDGLNGVATANAFTTIPVLKATMDAVTAFIQAATKLNVLIDKTNDTLDAINTVLTAAGITTLPNDSALGTLSGLAVPLKLNKVPEPPFTTLELEGLSGNTALAASVTQWAEDYKAFKGGTAAAPMSNAVGTTNLATISTLISSPLTVTIQGVTDPVQLNNLFMTGVPERGIKPLAIVNFYDTIKKTHENLQEIIDKLQENPTSDNSSLLQRLLDVMNDINASGFATLESTVGASFNPTSTTHFAAIQSFAQNWLIDKNNQISSTDISSIGKIQNNLGYAISAAQSLNDSQKEATRRFLFIFEEFYKSASTILSKITQIIEKIAQGINR